MSKGTPQIRIGRFIDNEWSLTRFGELVIRISIMSEQVELPRIEYEDIISERGALNKDVNKKQCSKRGIKFNDGDILFGKLRPYLKNWFHAEFEGLAVGDWWVYRTEKCDSKFIYYLIQGSKYQSVANQSTGTKMPRSDWNRVSNEKYLIPNEKKEQQQIGLFFKKIDDLINVSQRELELLQETKKAFMQKLFPKTGSNVPDLRFEGFVGAWEQERLGRVLMEFSDKSKIENEHRVLSSTNIGMEPREGRVSGQSNIGYKIVEDGDLVLSPQNLWLGNININNIGKGLVSPSYKTFKFKDIDSNFIKPQLRTPKMMKSYKDSSTQGASVVRRNLDSELFDQIIILIPGQSEQQRIGLLFQHLDSLITLHQSQLDSYKELKKGFLQKMFV